MPWPAGPRQPHAPGQATAPARHLRATGATPGGWMLFNSKDRRASREVKVMKVYTKPEAKKVDQGTIVASVR
ncbi:hypothetical protein [Streptomyces sp. NPDC059979]|uniref:hypothetical protein n=1 Tax=unclassified Streptomyces TaxID=2593676 RepID=UPI0036495321